MSRHQFIDLDGDFRRLRSSEPFKHTVSALANARDLKTHSYEPQ
jgi:hypothetical protein